MRGTYGPFLSVSLVAFVAGGVLFAANPKWGGIPVRSTEGPVKMEPAPVAPVPPVIVPPAEGPGAAAPGAEVPPAVSTLPPSARRIDHAITTKFGATRNDPYYWLRDKDNPEVIAYLNAENAYAAGQMAALKPLEHEIAQEMALRLGAADEQVPYAMGGYLYQERYAQGANYPQIVRRQGTAGAPEETVLDVPALAQGHAQYNLNAWEVSPDGTKVAFAVDVSGNRVHEIFVRDLTSGAVVSTGVKDGDGSIVWTVDGQAFLYGRVDETVRTNQIKRHKLADTAANDAVVLQEDDTTFSLSVGKTRSHQMAIITVGHLQRTELRAVSLTSPNARPVTLVSRWKNVRAYADHYDGTFYILTNDGAPDLKLESRSDRNPAGRSTLVVPEVQGHYLETFTIIDNKIVLQETHDAVTTLRIVDLATGVQTPLNLGELGYAALEQNEDAGLTTLRATFQSLTAPETLFEVDLRTHAVRLLKQDPAWIWFKPELYAAERIQAHAQDGQTVPVTLFYRKDLKKPGGNPTLIYGYGAYGISTPPTFLPTWVSLVDRGFVFAIAHVRGGRDLGNAWYEDGRMAHKMNSFTDFVSVTEGLIAQGYAQPDKIYARGGSAGGLLMGAVVNLRGVLYDGVIAEVPFVDVLTTMLDDTIPLTTFEYEEWGNPNISEQYDWMAAYSPYDNVTAKSYPPLFVATGLNDSQVGYFEPAKWVAKLRATKTDPNPILFLTNMGAGHSGDSGRTGIVDERSKMIAWLLDRARQ